MTNDSHIDPSHRGAGGFFSREAVSGIPWMIIGKLVLFFVYFGVSIVTVNGLGKEKFGVYSLMTNISSYMLVFCGLGLGTALMRYIPELAARQNRFGLIHLLWKSAALQVIAVVAMSALVLSFADPLQRLFQTEHVLHFRFYLKLACGLTALLLLKDFVGTVFTSIFKTRTVALLSVTQGVVWFLVLFSWLMMRPDVDTAFLAQIFSTGLIYGLGACLLFHYVHTLRWDRKEFGIGKRRALLFSGTVMFSSILRMVMFKYSEVFFLAAAGGTTLAGIYDLGYSLPYTVITFFPLALLPLFTSAFAEAYIRDQNCLGLLINSYYKLLMMVSLPISVLGFCFAPEAYHIIYHGLMDEAGAIAAAFSIALVLPLVSMPLSAAIKAKEKVLNMMPLLILQIVVNILLDWLLIIHFRLGIWGGLWAVVGTFVLTLPVRMWVVRRILGGIHFPVGFFLRILLSLSALGAALQWMVTRVDLFALFQSRWINIGLLFGVGVLYMLMFLLLIRLFRLVRREDIEDFHALGIEPLNKVLRFLVR
ncbi:MAG: oligosaccharide flippase family protein [Kiritimatiellales bacterium]|nr:oligosaccharide flippase family protein [Kiritimatiellales bacterium]